MLRALLAEGRLLLGASDEKASLSPPVASLAPVKKPVTKPPTQDVGGADKRKPIDKGKPPDTAKEKASVVPEVPVVAVAATTGTVSGKQAPTRAQNMEALLARLRARYQLRGRRSERRQDGSELVSVPGADREARAGLTGWSDRREDHV